MKYLTTLVLEPEDFITKPASTKKIKASDLIPLTADSFSSADIVLIEVEGKYHTVVNKTLPILKSSTTVAVAPHMKSQIEDIINHFNTTTHSECRLTNKAFAKNIITRLKEYTVDEIKDVITLKSMQWFNDVNMQGYLRHETLLGNKFHGYHQEVLRIKKNKALSANLQNKVQSQKSQSNVQAIIEQAQANIKKRNHG